MEENIQQEQSFGSWFSDEFLSGRFVKSFIEWVTTVIQTADVSIVLLILVILPLIVPATPAYVTYDNLLNVMHFTWQAALTSGITMELLGYAGALLLLQFSTDWFNKKKNAGWMTLIAGLSYLFYLIAIVSINVALDTQAGKDSTYVWVIGLLCLLSVPSGLLSATRIMSKSVKEEEEKNKAEEQSLQEKLNNEAFARQQLLSQQQWERDQASMAEKNSAELRRLEILANERVEKAKARASAKTSIPASIFEATSKNNFNFEAQGSTQASIPSQKTKFVEAVAEYIEAVIKDAGRMPKLTEVTGKFGGSESNAYYAIIEYIVGHGDLLVSNNIIQQEKLDKAVIAWEKKNKNKKG